MDLKKAKEIYIISAPSATGKTTINRRLIAEHSAQLAMSISYTAREKRVGENDGVDYHYVSKAFFEELITNNEMLEYAKVYDIYYGTRTSGVVKLIKAGKKVLIEIDTQGWMQLQEKLLAAESIFILPPSIKTLWHRLSQRGTESTSVMYKRLLTAKKEIEHGVYYNNFIINEHIDEAYKELEELIFLKKQTKLSRCQGKEKCLELINEFENSSWVKEIAEKAMK